MNQRMHACLVLIDILFKFEINMDRIYQQYCSKMKNISPHFVLDLDECAESVDGCEQVCINSVGSFSCDCNTGYDLQPDLKACQGEYFFYIRE